MRVSIVDYTPNIQLLKSELEYLKREGVNLCQNNMLTLRLTDEQHKALKLAANKSKMSINSFVAIVCISHVLEILEVQNDR